MNVKASWQIGIDVVEKRETEGTPGEGAGHCRVVCQSTGSCHRLVCGRKESAAGAEPDAAHPAAGSRCMARKTGLSQTAVVRIWRACGRGEAETRDAGTSPEVLASHGGRHVQRFRGASDGHTQSTRQSGLLFNVFMTHDTRIGLSAHEAAVIPAGTG